MHNEARQLLEQVAATYASMSSYADAGCVSQHLQPSDSVLRTDFSTLYAAPELFRFEFSRPHPYAPLRHMVTRHVVGFDGFGAYALRQEYEMPPALQARQNLSDAVSGAAGISAGAAQNIARLLLSDLEGLSILDLAGPRMAEGAEVGGAACLCVCALLPRGGERRLWVERNSLLVRRIQTHRDKISLDERRHEIRVNLPLDEALFDIESPDPSSLQDPVRAPDAKSN
jgi:hypothetical protein